MTTYAGDGRELRARREALKLSRREFAELCGYPSQTRIFNMETKDSWKAGDRDKVGDVLDRLEQGSTTDEEAAADYGVEVFWPADEPDDETEGQSAPLVAVPAQVSGQGQKVAEVSPQRPPSPSSVIGDPAEVGTPNRRRPLPSIATPITEVCPTCGDYYYSSTHVNHTTVQPTVNGHSNDPQDVSQELEEGEGVYFAAVPAFVPTDELTRERPLTNSEAHDFLRCPRKWWLTWYRGLVFNHSNPSDPRATGGRIHRALAAWYVPDGQVPADPREALEKIIQEDWAEVEENVRRSDSSEDPDTVLARLSTDFTAATELERAIVEGYLQWLEETGSDAKLHITDSEQALEVVIDGEVAGQYVRVKLKGKLDVRATRTSDGARLFLDHKSVQNFATPMKTLHMDPQMLHYMLLEAVGGDTPAGEPFALTALYNMLRKVKRTAQARPPFFQRAEIHHSPIEVESYRKRLLGIARDTARKTRELDEGHDPLPIAYPNPTKDCSWDCDFFPVCPMFDDGSRVEDALAALYHVSDPLARYGDLTPE